MRRTIKSYVLRGGRTSTRQLAGLERWFDAYKMPAESLWDFGAIFKRQAPTIVEIGFGMGASLLAMAQLQPEVNFIGIEVHRAGIGSLAAELHQHEMTNVRIVDGDAVEAFKHCIPDNSLAAVQIFFPDPWPKKRHHKRRLIQTDFVTLLATKLQSQGALHCATDWQEYAEYMQAVLNNEARLINQQSDGGYAPKPSTRPQTKFESRGQRLGHGVWDLIYLKR